MTNGIRHYPLMSEIEESLALRLETFSDRWIGQYRNRQTFEKMMATLKASAIANVASRVNAALTAKESKKPVAEFQKEFINFMDPHFSPQLVGNTLERGRFEQAIKVDALKFLKDFANFVGEKAIAHFGMPDTAEPSSIKPDVANHQIDEISTPPLFSPETLAQRQQEILLEMDKLNPETELMPYIKRVLSPESLSISNRIRRLQTGLSKDEFQTQYAHLISFHEFLNHHIQLATDKHEQAEIAQRVTNATGIAALKAYRDHTLQPRFRQLMDKIKSCSGSTIREFQMSAFLEEQIHLLEEKIKSLHDQTQQIIEEKSSVTIQDIRETIALERDSGTLTRYKKENIVHPLSALMKQIRDKRKNGEDVSEDLQRKEELENLFFRASHKIERLQSLGHTPQETRPAASNVIPFLHKKPVETTPAPHPKTPWYQRAQSRFAVAASIAITTAATAAITMLGIFNAPTIAQSTVKQSAEPNELVMTFNTVATVTAPTELIPIESPKVEKVKIKVNASFKSSTNDNDIIKPAPAMVSGFQMKTVTQSTLDNLCRTGAYTTWVCANG